MIPKHCPVCGRGLSRKYQTGSHPRRWAKHILAAAANAVERERLRRTNCSWAPR